MFGPGSSGYPIDVLRADEESTGSDAEDQPARDEPPPPLVRPWERRAGSDRRPAAGRPEPAEGRLGPAEADVRGRPTLVVGSAVVLAACTALLVTTDPWAPSAGARGEVAWVLALLALGLAAGRPGVPVGTTFRAMVLPAALLAVLAPLSRAESPFAWAMLAIPLMGAGGAVLVGLAAGGSRRAVARVPVARRVLPRLAIAAATLAVVVAGWGVQADARVIDRTPAEPVALSDRTGAFRGVEVRDRLRDVRERLGTPAIVPAGDRAAGLPVDAGDGLALPGDLPDGETWRYEGLALIVGRSRVLAMVVTDDRAQTGAGVGIGDSLEVVRRAYGGLSCRGVRFGNARNPAHPSCRSRLPGRVGLRRIGVAFSGDPVQSVVLQRGATGPLLEGGDPR